MRYNVIIAGVGGQGIISIASVITLVAVHQGLQVRQSEIHGMSQRGGSVSVQVRIADAAIYSDIIPKGTADLILSMEPLEALRYVDYLSPNGILVTAREPVVNIPDYPHIENLYRSINVLPHAYMIDSKNSTNMILIGAAMRFLPLDVNLVKLAIWDLFVNKGEEIIENNLQALASGMNMS